MEGLRCPVCNRIALYQYEDESGNRFCTECNKLKEGLMHTTIDPHEMSECERKDYESSFNMMVTTLLIILIAFLGCWALIKFG